MATRQQPAHPVDDRHDVALLEQLARAHKGLVEQIGRRIVGQHKIVDDLVAALLAGGHVLLVGVPGLAKTLLVQTVAQALDLSFSRVQFTPDLMPSDITGTEILEEDHTTGKRVFRFAKGPIFANVVLADEINRAPPKTQAALLQAMQEHAVTTAGQTHKLPEPFFVLATQNPIEQEGTYPLPEAQLDRFMMQLLVGYPSRDEEERIVAATTGDIEIDIQPMLTRRAALAAPASRAPAPGAAVAGELRGQARPLHAPRRRGSDAVGEEVRELGRRPPRVAVPHPRRQGARRDGRPRDAGFRGCECDGGSRAQPSRGRELPGRGGRDVAGAARRGTGAAVARVARTVGPPLPPLTAVDGFRVAQEPNEDNRPRYIRFADSRPTLLAALWIVDRSRPSTTHAHRDVAFE